MFVNAPKIERNIRFTGQQSSSTDERQEQPWGERRFVRNHYNEFRASFEEVNAPRRKFDVVFRLCDDGLAFATNSQIKPAWKTCASAVS